MSFSPDMSAYKVVVLGGCGVGKTTFVNSICSKFDPCPSSTVGCVVSVVAHQYRAGSAEEKTVYFELWDIGGSNLHQKASAVFLEGAAGAILVHDLSNSKSETSLLQWLAKLRGENFSTHNLMLSIDNQKPLLIDVEGVPIPTLVVGCKIDAAPHRAKQSGYGQLSLDARNELVPGSTNRLILTKFFDSVVERKRVTTGSERRRRILL